VRVLHVIPSLATSHGGPTYALFGLVRALCAADVSVEVLATRADLDAAGEAEARDRLVGGGARVTLVPVIGPAPLQLAPALLPALVDRVRHVDLVHVHSVFTWPAALPPLVCRVARVPYIVRPAGTLDAACIGSRGERRKRAALAAYVRRNARGAAAVQATSAREAAELAALLPGANVVVVENGIDLDAAVAEPRVGDGRRIGFLGRLHPKKRVEVLLEALARLDPQVVLEVAGAGEPSYEAALRDRAAALGIAPRVCWLGHIGAAAKRELFSRCQVLAFPSLDENFGVAVAEALAAGRPVVVSPGVALGEDIVAADAGLVSPGEPEPFARALDRLLTDGAARERQGVNARELAQRRWAWPRIADRTLALYRDISG
jgi:glycosyltransferase involved in cell wall biosynthesis